MASKIKNIAIILVAFIVAGAVIFGVSFWNTGVKRLPMRIEKETPSGRDQKYLITNVRTPQNTQKSTFPLTVSGVVA